jgi:ubiquitin C-terminal hydrolase
MSPDYTPIEMAEDMSKRGCLGLANLGNTCFMNAVLQAMRNNKEWTMFCVKDNIDSYIQKEDTGHKKLLLAYIDLLKSIWNGSGPGYVQPAGFYNELKEVVRGTIYDDFARRQPQDAHEFLVWLLDQMYMATQSEVVINIKDEDKIEPMIRQALNGWKTAFEKQWSPLTDLVFGLYRIQYKCSVCDTTHTRWETFNTLKYSLAMDEERNPLPLIDALKEEFKEETIDEYACDKCAPKRAPATKNVRIWRLPKLLIITAKRFAPNGSKIHNPVNLSHTEKFHDVFAKESHEPSKHIEYNLFATVDHHGSHYGGHYTAQSKMITTGEWAHFDDESMSAIQGPSLGRSTYMTFWSQA